MKKLMVLSAIPGSGKSTYASNYMKNHTDENCFIVSSDELRLEIGGAAQNFEHEELVWKTYFERIEEYAKKYDKVTVFADSTNIINVHRRQAGQVPGFDYRVLLVFKKDVDIIEKSNRKREPGRVVPDYAMERMFKRWEEVDEETKKVFDEVIYINGWFDKSKI